VWNVWGERRCAYRILVGKPEGNGAFVEDIDIDGDNIKVERLGWFSFVQRRDKSRTVVNTGIKLPVCGEFFD
jgi:hypothetical protein